MNAQVVEHIQVAGGVVVGNDGSPSSRDALVWAAEDARRRRTTLHVVRAWTMTTAPRPADWSPGYVPSLVEFEAACRQEAERQVAEIVGTGPDPAVQVHTFHGPASRALIEASEGADVVVVGSRGRSGVQELLLGSVAEHSVRHSHCPVVVVRPSRRRRQGKERPARS